MLKKTVKVIPLLALVILLATLGGCGSDSNNNNVSGNGGGSAAIAGILPETEIAEVNGTVITFGELDEYTLLAATNARKNVDEISEEEFEGLRKETLETMITNKLIRQYMEELGLESMTMEAMADAEMIDQTLRMNYNLTRLVDLGKVSAQILEDFIAYAQYSNWFYIHTITTVDLSDEVVDAYIEEHKDELKRTMVSVSHILTKTQEDAEEALRRLENGEKFEDLAEELSRDEGTAPFGGVIMDFGRNEVLPEIEAAVFSMEVGEIKGPVKSMRGFHIFWLRDKYLEELPYQVIEPHVKDTIVRSACNEKIKELRQNASIVYNSMQ